jgi:RNA polymerase sigma-70 factor (ECF subfamily)
MSGGFRTHVVADRITRASCFVCRDAADALTLARWLESRVAEMREFLRGRVGDREVADELIQSAWVAISSRADDRSIDNPDAWLQRVVTNLALNWLKSSRFRSRIVHGDEDLSRFEDAAPLQDELAEHRQSMHYLAELLDELPPHRRQVFLLYRGEGLSLQETADRLGISIKTVTTQLQRTMIFLRKRMREADLWP